MLFNKLYCIVLYCIVLYCIVLYCIVWSLQERRTDLIEIFKMVRGFTSTSWTFFFHSAEDKSQLETDKEPLSLQHSITVILSTGHKSLEEFVWGRYFCVISELLNVVSRKKIVRWTSLKTHSLQVLLAAWVRKSDGFGQDGKGHRQVQQHLVSYSGGRRLNDTTSIQSVTFSRYGDATIKVSTIACLTSVNYCSRKRMQQSKRNVKSHFFDFEKKRKIRLTYSRTLVLTLFSKSWTACLH